MGKAIRLDKFLADAGSGTRSEVKKYSKGKSSGQRYNSKEARTKGQ
jgi:16S rRNA pseudouridine516 synthase